eukprot:3394169-Amphidinium_carterae.1
MLSGYKHSFLQHRCKGEQHRVNILYSWTNSMQEIKMSDLSNKASELALATAVMPGKFQTQGRAGALERYNAHAMHVCFP